MIEYCPNIEKILEDYNITPIIFSEILLKSLYSTIYYVLYYEDRYYYTTYTDRLKALLSLAEEDNGICFTLPYKDEIFIAIYYVNTDEQSYEKLIHKIMKLKAFL